MCGICGFISKKEVGIEQLKKMNDTMYHRGPNDSGEELYKIGKGFFLGMAHRRLSILDLSSLGHQPMHSRDGRITVVFNGEIYNFKDIRNELNGYEFKSTCDTEVIIAAYLKWGIKCVEKFNGMFAIALYDRQTEELHLIRDRMGKKPLYYWCDGENLVYASELKAIMAYPGFRKEIRTDILPRYIYHQYINAPDTVFKDVYKLESGAGLTYNYGKITKWKYWDVADVYSNLKNSFKGDFAEAKSELKKLLEESVRLRMISDVPLGSFLSGGYDSSLITAVAQSLSDSPINTFAIGFDDENYNEAKFAKQIAEYLGTNHTELYISEKNMYDLVDSIPKYYDEPFADSSQIPSMLVAALAKEKVTVALSGDGGDELFCGYNAYTLVEKAQKLDGIGAALYYLLGGVNSKIYQKLPNAVKIIVANRNRETKTQFASSGYFECAFDFIKEKQGKTITYPFESKYNEKNWQEIRMLLDMETYLPGDILCKVDRATMKYSLEARCPLLDKNIVEFSYAIPHKYKYNNGNKKYILKELAYEYIPKELLDRPKVGFAVPLDKWLAGPLKEQIMDYSSYDYIKKQDIFDADYIRKYIDYFMTYGDGGAGTGANYSKFIWSFLVFQKWYDEFFV